MCTEQTEHVCMQSAWYGTVHGVVQLHICKQFSAQQKMHFWDKYCEMQWIKRICNLFSFLFIGSSLFPFSSSRPFSYAPKSYALFKNWIYMFVFNPTPSHGNGLLYANKANEKKKTNREGHKNKTIWQTEKAKEERKKKSERKTKLEHVFRTRRIMHSVCKRHKYFRMLPNWMDSDNRNYFNSFRFIRSIFGRLFCYIFVVIHKFSQRIEYGICNQTKRSAKPTKTSICIHVKFILIDFWKRIDHTISKYSTCFCFSAPCIAM